MNRLLKSWGLLVVVLVFILSACGGSTAVEDTTNRATLPKVVMYKSPTCGCCGKWATYMRANGFRVEERIADNLWRLKDRYGVPPQARSCHTAIVGDYVVEGHVPAQEVKRLLTERPDVVGIAVPGMPIGSPGMEVPGQPAEPFTVVAFDRAGNVSVFAEYTP